MKEVSFTIRPQTLTSDVDYLVHLSGIVGKHELLSTLCIALRFPDYFGYNWDALDECLRDLEWIEQRRIVIVHDDLPQLTEKDLSTYLNVLIDAIRGWNAHERHSLEVIFPESSRGIVEAACVRSDRM